MGTRNSLFVYWRFKTRGKENTYMSVGQYPSDTRAIYNLYSFYSTNKQINEKFVRKRGCGKKLEVVQVYEFGQRIFAFQWYKCTFFNGIFFSGVCEWRTPRVLSLTSFERWIQVGVSWDFSQLPYSVTKNPSCLVLDYTYEWQCSHDCHRPNSTFLRTLDSVWPHGSLSITLFHLVETFLSLKSFSRKKRIPKKTWQASGTR